MLLVVVVVTTGQHKGSFMPVLRHKIDSGLLDINKKLSDCFIEHFLDGGK